MRKGGGKPPQSKEPQPLSSWHRRQKRCEARKRSTAGFTVMELLVTILVLAIMVAIVHQGFTMVAFSTDIARENAEALRFRQFLWRNLTENLSAVYADPACLQPEYQFVGESKDGPFGPADSLRFCTSLPMSGAHALPGILRVVSYEVVEPGAAEGDAMGRLAIDVPVDQDAPLIHLVIREEPLVLESTDTEAKVDALLDSGIERRIPISSMNVLYYDGRNDEWVEDWDSTAEGVMPWAVRVQINFARSQDERLEELRAGISAEDEADLDISIAIPIGAGVVGPFMDLNRRRATTLVEDRTGELFGGGTQSNQPRTQRR